MLNSSLNFKPLSQTDFPQVSAWFNEPHVQQFYSLHKWTLEQVTKKLSPYLEENTKVHAFICLLDGNPIGYIQYYHLVDYPFPTQDLPQNVMEKTAGIDLFIGDPSYLKKGLGHDIVKQFLEQNIWPYYQFCMVDPNILNLNAINFFSKLGFKKHIVISTTDALLREIRAQLMILEK